MQATNAERWRYVLAGVAMLALASIGPARRHLRAAAVLTRLEDPAKRGALADYGRSPVDVSASMLPIAETPGLSVRVRTYRPRGLEHPPGVVLLHGVHRLGVDEPRLVRFAEALASAGIVVMTPELHDLTDYRVDAAGVPVIGAAARALHRETGRAHGVGLLGMSFAGGLSLIAAADPRFQPDIAFVLALGAHDDLSRVLQFFSTTKEPRPDGGEDALTPHEYGLFVLVYSHVEAFFDAADVPEAREALRMWLWEDRDTARRRIANLSPDGQAKMKLLVDHDVGALSGELRAEIERQQRRAAEVSPHAHTAGVHVPVLLLHGAGDSVIPPAETLWLAHDFPTTRDALVSEAIQHVELHGEPGALEHARVVHFMAEVLEQVEAE